MLCRISFTYWNEIFVTINVFEQLQHKKEFSTYLYPFELISFDQSSIEIEYKNTRSIINNTDRHQYVFSTQNKETYLKDPTLLNPKKWTINEAYKRLRNPSVSSWDSLWHTVNRCK